ncbi:MAG: hypothetical protein ABI577_05665 [bacterium]
MEPPVDAVGIGGSDAGASLTDDSGAGAETGWSNAVCVSGLLAGATAATVGTDGACGGVEPAMARWMGGSVVPAVAGAEAATAGVEDGLATAPRGAEKSDGCSASMFEAGGGAASTSRDSAGAASAIGAAGGTGIAAVGAGVGGRVGTSRRAPWRPSGGS